MSVEELRHWQLSKAVAENPKDAAALFERSALFLSLGWVGPSVADAEASLALDPSRSETLVVRALARCHDDRIQDWTAALLKAPEKMRARIAQGSRLAVQECSTALNFCRDDGSVSEVLLARAAAFLWGGDISRCLQDCQRALEIDGQNASALLMRGICYLETKSYDKAAKDFRRSSERHSAAKELYSLAKELYKASASQEELAQRDRRRQLKQAVQ